MGAAGWCGNVEAWDRGSASDGGRLTEGNGSMAQGFIHVNGVDYKLHGEMDADQVARIGAHLASGEGTQRLAVKIDGRVTDVTFRLDRVWAAGSSVREGGGGSKVVIL